MYLEEYYRLPTGRRIVPPLTGERIVATNVMTLPIPPMGEFMYERFLRDTSPTDSTTGYSTTAAAASCHDIDIEGVVEEGVVEGDDMLYIQRYPYHILIF